MRHKLFKYEGWGNLGIYTAATISGMNLRSFSRTENYDLVSDDDTRARMREDDEGWSRRGEGGWYDIAFAVKGKTRLAHEDGKQGAERGWSGRATQMQI